MENSASPIPKDDDSSSIIAVSESLDKETNSQISEHSDNHSINEIKSSDSTAGSSKQDDIYSDHNYVKAFSSLLNDQLNVQDVSALLQCQNKIIQRLDDTNKKLVTTNQKSSDVFNSYAIKDFQLYITLLTTMKSDLDFIFKRIKIIKSKLQAKHPNSYNNAVETVQRNRLSENDDIDEEDEEEYKPILKETPIPNEQDLLKVRTTSIDSSASNSSQHSANTLVNLLQTARDRITSSSKDLVNGLISSNPANNNNNSNNIQVNNLTDETTAANTQPAESNISSN